MPARQLRSRNQVPAVDYFYSAAKRRSSGALWPIFAPALITGLANHFRYRYSHFCLLQYSNHLLHIETLLPHPNPSLFLGQIWPKTNIQTGSAIPGPIRHALKPKSSIIDRCVTRPDIARCSSHPKAALAARLPTSFYGESVAAVRPRANSSLASASM